MASSPVNSVRLAVDVLKCLSSGNTRVTDIALKLGISKSTAHRLLKTLESAGMVAQDPVYHTYRTGKVLFQLAYPLVSSHQRLIYCASDEMDNLRKLTGETVILYVRNGKEIICVEELPGLNPIKYTFGKGNTMPWNVGAASKALLAELTDDEIRKALVNLEFKKYTPYTNINKDLLLESVRETRKQGFATSYNAYEPGAAAISVPIRNYIMPVALSILGSETKFGQQIPHVIDDIKNSAEKISDKLAQEF